MTSTELLFPCQQRFLPFDAPVISAQAAAACDHAMAGNQQCHGIGGAGAGYGARGPRLADGARDLAIGARAAARALLQGFPNALLKRRGPDIERQLRPRLPAVQLFQKGACPGVQPVIVVMDLGGGKFAPQVVGLEKNNTRLQGMGRGRGVQATDDWSIDEQETERDLIAAPTSWLKTLNQEQQAVAQNLPLRRDMTTLLAYLRDNKVTGTQSTGNLPLKAVHAICARFVNPLKLEEVVGEHAFRVRSETEVWPLYFRHVLASIAGLVTGGLGRRWKLTPLGEVFLAAPAPLQVWHLFTTWWLQINWVIASPYGYDDGYLPAGFSGLTLTHLLELPAGIPASFDQFADRIIEEAGLVWPIQNQDSAHRILQGIIEHTVIYPMVDFGILETEYQPHRILGSEFRELSTFRITPFGKDLLVSMKKQSE